MTRRDDEKARMEILGETWSHTDSRDRALASGAPLVVEIANVFRVNGLRRLAARRGPARVLGQ
jgi:hypothetical protein